MKIAIDTSPLQSGHAGRGIGNYTRLLIDALKTYDTENQYTNFKYKDSDVIHYPFFDLFFLTLPIIKHKPTVVTIHDVIPLVFPEAYPPGLRGRIKFLIQKHSLSTAAHIVTDSNCSTKDVQKYLIPKSKISTVHLAPDPQYKPASQKSIDSVKNAYNIKHPYFLYVGDINYNKNLSSLLEAISATNNYYNLILVSKALKRNNPAAHNLWNLIDKLRIEPKLKIITDAHDIETMKALYSGAEWYIQPSLYEGFGLPVLEAQACGCPVISSVGGSLQEVIGKSALTINKPSIKNIGNSIQEAVVSTKRSAYIDKGFENVKRFSWEITALQMKEIYTACL